MHFLLIYILPKNNKKNGENYINIKYNINIFLHFVQPLLKYDRVKLDVVVTDFLSLLQFFR